jgi:hypothetical protein
MAAFSPTPSELEVMLGIAAGLNGGDSTSYKTPPSELDALLAIQAGLINGVPSGDGTGAPLGNVTPLMDGTATAGTSNSSARSNHVHPTDTSRLAASAVSTFGGTLIDDVDAAAARETLGLAAVYAPISTISANALGAANNPVTSASAVRPTGLTRVYWVCPTQPTNWLSNDEWVDNS